MVSQGVLESCWAVLWAVSLDESGNRWLHTLGLHRWESGIYAMHALRSRWHVTSPVQLRRICRRSQTQLPSKRQVIASQEAL